MSFSRWKLMAGVLGVSLGGLAALAGQCPKSDATKTARQAPDSSSKVEAPVIPAVPPAGSGSAPQVPPPAPSLPTPPTIPAPSSEVPAIPPPAPTKAPDALPIPPMPTAPAAASEPAKKPDAPPSIPPVPQTLPVVPASGTAPQPTPPAPAPDLPRPSTAPTVELKPTPTPPSTLPTSPAPVQDPLIKPPASAGTIPPPPASAGSATIPPLSDPSFDPPAPKPTPTGGVAGVTPVAATVQSKYRILLRVGEGEPTFEVRTGDDLLLKVVCEKVDIKSPEKGNGPSAVTARGKVRFAGFGAEGTCQELSFQAGSGEVTMAGDVKIQVKDKLGRVESELSTASVKYKIDPGTIGGSLKP